MRYYYFFGYLLCGWWKINGNGNGNGNGNRIKTCGVTVQKLLSGKKYLKTNNSLFLCQTSCCQNLMAIKQIPSSYNSFKVIPLKLFYYQTFFETWHNEHYKTAIKKMGSPCLFMRQQALKMDYFHWLSVLNSNHLHTELNLVTWKAQSFVLKVKFHLLTKAILLHLSRFWLPGCGDIALFRTVPWLTWDPRLGQNKPSCETISKKVLFSYQTFFPLQICSSIRLFLANTWNKNRGSLCSFREKENLFRYWA